MEEILKNKERFNKAFLYYKDDDGNIQMVAFQSGVFFTLEEGEPKMLNPILVGRILESLRNKELTLLGIGRYGKEIDVFQNYRNPNPNIKLW